MFFFTNELVFLWTQNLEIAAAVSPLVKILATGNFVSCLLYIPYQAQLAYGWTSLSVKVNVFAVILLIPALLLVTMQYGAIGAASIWLILNLGYFFIGSWLMFRRILSNEKLNWYINDVIIPVCMCSFSGYMAWIFFANSTNESALLVSARLIVSWMGVFILAIISTNRIRQYVFKFFYQNF